MMPVEWAESSKKHNVPRGDALYAMQNAILVSDKVSVTSGQSPHRRKVFIGPAHAQTDRLLEVLVELRPGGTFWVYHVMELGPKYRRLMEEGHDDENE